MNSVFAFAAERGCKLVRGVYRPTEKNQMVKDFYGRFGFTHAENLPDGSTVWTLKTDAYRPREVFMQSEEVTLEEARHEPG